MMIQLPPELLCTILSNLTQRHLRHCPLVCRIWYQIAQPLLYQRIEFYSHEQVTKFIDTRRRYRHITSGNDVQSIHLYAQLYLDCSLLASLQDICANVQLVTSQPGNGVSYDIRPCLLKKWKHLTTLTIVPSQDPSDSWHPVADQLIRISITPRSSPMLRIVDFMPAAQLSSLVQLDIKFCRLARYIRSPDDDFFNYLASSCPSLTTLTFTDVRYFDERERGSSSMGSFAPANSVTTLTVTAIYKHTETHFFDSYAKAFPNLTRLDLKLRPEWQGNDPTDASLASHRMAVCNFINHFPQLKDLCVHSIHIVSPATRSRNTVLPTTGMEDYLVRSGLTSLAWDDHSLFKSSTDLCRRSYLDHLTSLTVHIYREFTINDLLRFLLFDNTRSTIPDQLVSLGIQSEYRGDVEFDLPAWAKVSPRLKELSIRRCMIVDCHSDDAGKTSHFSQLKSLKLQRVGIDSKDGFTRLAACFPVLRHFSCLDTTWMYGDSYTHGENNELLLAMDAPHWELDNFYLCQLFFSEITNSDYTIGRVDLTEGNGTEARTLTLHPETIKPIDYISFSLRLKSINRLVFETH